MKSRFILVMMSMVLFASGCASKPPLISVDGEKLSTKDYDLVLKVTPIKVKPIVMNSVVDAVEGDAKNIQVFDKMVNFKIEQVLLGEYTMVKRGGPSRFEQIKDSQKNQDFLKMLTLDYDDPDEETMKPWISVAVKDPLERFGLENWNNPEQKTYRLYLQTLKETPKTYILKGVRYES